MHREGIIPFGRPTLRYPDPGGNLGARLMLEKKYLERMKTKNEKPDIILDKLKMFSCCAEILKNKNNNILYPFDKEEFYKTNSMLSIFSYFHYIFQEKNLVL